MKKLYIIDFSNWSRRRIQLDALASPIRACFYEIQHKPQDTLVIVVADGFNSLKARRDIYPEYKMKRTPAGEDIYQTMKWLYDLLKLSRAITIKMEGYEADDVIAAIALKYKSKFESVFIDSNDLDLYQLGLPMSRGNFPEEPQWVRLMKTMVGDPSDNIPGCKGFGKGAWEKLSVKQKQILEHILVSGHGLLTEDIEALVKDFFPPGSLKWFLEKENRDRLRFFYKIIGFLPIPWDNITKAMVQGTNRPDLVEPILREFMQ